MADFGRDMAWISQAYPTIFPTGRKSNKPIPLTFKDWIRWTLAVNTSLIKIERLQPYLN